MREFIEEMNYRKGTDEEGREYYEIDTHQENEAGDRVYVRITFIPSAFRHTSVPSILFQERAGSRLSDPVQLPTGCLPALMSSVVELMEK
jgi:hypothetical protein